MPITNSFEGLERKFDDTKNNMMVKKIAKPLPIFDTFIRLIIFRSSFNY